MIVRRYEAGDYEAVRRVHAEAFRRVGRTGALPQEVTLFDALLENGDVIAPLSLVVDVEGVPVGHVVCSRATVGADAVAALGPIGVVPRLQGDGIWRFRSSRSSARRRTTPASGSCPPLGSGSTRPTRRGATPSRPVR